MDRFRSTFLTAIVIGIFIAPAALAQPVAAKVEVVSGNGQMICPSCSGGNPYRAFYPLVVKVTDANGNPISGKTVSWTLVNFANGAPPEYDAVTVTNSAGLAYSRVRQGPGTATIYTGFVQSQIRASADAASALFTLTQALSQPGGGGFAAVSATLQTPAATTLTGPAGSSSATQIKVYIVANGTPVPNVSVRLGAPAGSAPKPTASCATGAGADPGSVLTDSSGNATCTPVLGAVVGIGPVYVEVGGLDPAQFDQTTIADEDLRLTDPVSYQEFRYSISVNVTTVAPGMVSVFGDYGQSVNPGATSTPLVVQVTDGSGTVPIANAKVEWTVIPAGAVTLSASQSTTDSQGKAQITATLPANASGLFTIKAALNGNASVPAATFSLSTRVLVSALAKVSGDSQTAQAGQNFRDPLVVSVIGTNGLPIVGQAVSFLPTGNISVSQTSVTTDVAGRAQVTVGTGSVPGTATVDAFVGTATVRFTLTVVAIGPALNTSAFFNAGGGGRVTALAPCSLVTVMTTGLAPAVEGLVTNANSFGPWANTFTSGTYTVTVTVNSIAAPVSSVGRIDGVEQLTFQVPCDAAPAASVPVVINVSGGSASVNMPIQAAAPGIFETVMSDGVKRAVVIRPDGSFVNVGNPARRGETVRVFVTGIGPTAPAMVTGSMPFAGADSMALSQIIVGVNNGGSRVVGSRASPNLIGVQEIAFEVPSDAPVGNDVVLSVAVNAPGDSQTRFSNGSKMPIAQ